MPIDYALYPSNFVKESNEYNAKVIAKNTVDQNDIIQFIAEQGSTISTPDILGVLDLQHKAITHFLNQGFRIKTPLVNFGLTIKGKFDGPKDIFDESRHKLEASLSSGSALRKEMKKRRKMHRRMRLSSDPVPQIYRDYSTDTYDTYLTPAKVGQLTGHSLKFNEDDPEQGIYIINKDDKQATKVNTVMHNAGTKLIFEVPNTLPPGNYTIEVYAALGDNYAVQKGNLYKTLTVV